VPSVAVVPRRSQTVRTACGTRCRHPRRYATRPTPITAKFDAADVGCASLVAGTMVGAGVLALPAVSAPSGFVPASLVRADVSLVARMSFRT
jgi:hypothetical protein